MTNEQPRLTINKRSPALCFGLGLQQPGEAERHLGRYLERIVTPEGYPGEA
jgi:hypothetical protein